MTEMGIDVLFFGVLADVTGTSRKHYSGAGSYDDLWHRVMDDFPEVIHYNFRIALNNEIVTGSPAISDGDEVACIPPFGGG